jgi:hypothetical protein
MKEEFNNIVDYFKYKTVPKKIHGPKNKQKRKALKRKCKKYKYDPIKDLLFYYQNNTV